MTWVQMIRFKFSRLLLVKIFIWHSAITFCSLYEHPNYSFLTSVGFFFCFHSLQDTTNTLYLVEVVLQSQTDILAFTIKVKGQTSPDSGNLFTQHLQQAFSWMELDVSTFTRGARWLIIKDVYIKAVVE